MTEHSPGPWAFEPFNTIEEPTGLPIAGVNTEWFDEGEWQANAHLIAAAPDLLQACDATLALAEWIASFDGEPTHRRPSESELTRRTIELIAPLTEAIAKARGQAVAS